MNKDGRVRLNKASYERNRHSSGNGWSAINRTLPVLLVPTTSHRHGQRWNSFARHVPESQPSSTKEVPSPEETQNVPDYDSADEGDISDWSASMDDSQQLDGFYGISTPPTPIFRHDFCREIINPPPPPEPTIPDSSSSSYQPPYVTSAPPTPPPPSRDGPPSPDEPPPRCAICLEFLYGSTFWPGKTDSSDDDDLLWHCETCFQAAHASCNDEWIVSHLNSAPNLPVRCVYWYVIPNTFLNPPFASCVWGWKLI